MGSIECRLAGVALMKDHVSIRTDQFGIGKYSQANPSLGILYKLPVLWLLMSLLAMTPFREPDGASAVRHK